MTRYLKIAAAALGAVVLAGGGILLYANHCRSYKYIFPNVTCDGLSLSGMSREEAETELTKWIADNQDSVTLEFPDGTSFPIIPDQTRRESEPGKALDAAWSYGREAGGFFGPMATMGRARTSAYDVPLSLTTEYSDASVRSQVEAVRDQITLLPTDCTGDVDSGGHQVTVQLGEEGRTIDPEAVSAQVLAALNAGQETLSLDYDPIPLDEAQTDALLHALSEESAVAVTEPSLEYDEASSTALVHTGTPGYSMDLAEAEALVSQAEADGIPQVTIPLEETAPPAYDLAAYYAWLKRDPVNSYALIDGDLVGGDPGYDMDYPAAEAALTSAAYGDTVEIPIEVIPPRMSKESAWSWLFYNRLGSSDTYHTADSSRTTNLRLACAAIDGTVINPGEVFSFNNVVGERTADKGYQYGIVYVNSSSEPQLGGGICQVATGCYQAALKSGMEILERDCHMFQVTYCAGGLDATVYWGSVDLKFKNPWPMPIRVNASVSNGQVHISIDGSNFSGQYIRLTSEYLGGLSYRAYRTVYNADGSVYSTEDLGVSTYKSH